MCKEKVKKDSKKNQIGVEKRERSDFFRRKVSKIALKRTWRRMRGKYGGSTETVRPGPDERGAIVGKCWGREVEMGKKLNEYVLYYV